MCDKLLTVQKQIDYLEKNKKIKFNIVSKEEAREFLYTHKYINVITPFEFKLNKRNITEKSRVCHLYDSVEFAQYKDEYIKEREIYVDLYKSITKFETTFNAILSYETINFYNIDSHIKFENFIYKLRNNINNSEMTLSKKMHMLKKLSSFEKRVNKCDDIDFFLENLSISELVSLYESLDERLAKKIFKQLLIRECTFGYSRKNDFDLLLPIIILVRNYIMHGNSITILIRYYDIRTKEIRKSTDRKRIATAIKKMIEYKPL